MLHDCLLLLKYESLFSASFPSLFVQTIGHVFEASETLLSFVDGMGPKKVSQIVQVTHEQFTQQSQPSHDQSSLDHGAVPPASASKSDVPTSEQTNSLEPSPNPG